MLNLIDSKGPFWKKRLTFPPQRKLNNGPPTRQNDLPVRVVQFQIKLVRFKAPVIRQRQTHQARIQHGSHIFTFNGDAETGGFAVQVQEFRAEIHCSNPPTVFFILPIAEVAESCKLLS